jgi:RNA polymerase sigma-70 factor (ECF subfamily)
MIALPTSWLLASERGEAEVVALGRVRELANDTRRIEELFTRLERPLTNVLYRWLWSREDVRDAIQDAFVRLWQMRERVEWERAEPLIYRIALNVAANRRRRRALWRWAALDDDTRAAPDEVADPEREAAVRRAIDALPERHRRVLTLAVHAELSHEQIADVLGIPVGTVASRRNTAVRKLRAKLERER